MPVPLSQSSVSFSSVALPKMPGEYAIQTYREKGRFLAALCSGGRNLQWNFHLVEQRSHRLFSLLYDRNWQTRRVR